MTYKQAIALRNELENEKHYNLVYADRCDKTDRQAGYKVVAVVSVDGVRNGRPMKQVVEEDHFLNNDRTGTLHI